MLSLTHIIFLIINVVLIVGMTLLTKKFKWNKKTLLTIMFISAILSELVIFGCNYKEYEDTGYYYILTTELPLHLCGMSILFYIGLGSIWKHNEKAHDLLLGYLWFPSILGATISLILGPMIFKDYSFSNLQVIEYNFWHSMLVFMGIQIIAQKMVVIDSKRFVKNLCFLAGLAYLAMFINSFLQGLPGLDGNYANYYYLAAPPADNLPFLNTKSGGLVYLLRVLLTAIVMMFLCHLPFIVKEIKNKKENKNKSSL